MLSLYLLNHCQSVCTEQLCGKEKILSFSFLASYWYRHHRLCCKGGPITPYFTYQSSLINQINDKFRPWQEISNLQHNKPQLISTCLKLVMIIGLHAEGGDDHRSRLRILRILLFMTSSTSTTTIHRATTGGAAAACRVSLVDRCDTQLSSYAMEPADRNVHVFNVRQL